MSKERMPKTKILSHSVVAIGGVAAGYLVQRRKLNRARQANQASRFAVLRLQGDVSQAERDDITGLQRRGAIAKAYTGLVASASRRQRSGEYAADPKANRHSILMLDLDHFKTINDKYGHNEGDEILGLVAGIIIDRVRERDVVARWGGEEISVLLPRATEADAVAIAEDLREAFEGTGRVKASFGVAEMDLSNPLTDNVGLADQALYAAKEGGRNRVVAYSSLSPIA